MYVYERNAGLCNQQRRQIMEPPWFTLRTVVCKVVPHSVAGSRQTIAASFTRMTSSSWHHSHSRATTNLFSAIKQRTIYCKITTTQRKAIREAIRLNELVALNWTQSLRHDFGRVPWFSAIAIILRHSRESQRTVCNFSIWKVSDVGLYKKALLWQRNRKMQL